MFDLKTGVSIKPGCAACYWHFTGKTIQLINPKLLVV
jgi:hypothetical protein